MPPARPIKSDPVMTTFQIKLLAITAMVVDHIGLFFFPQIIYFRIIGRLAFPLFAWMIANGAHHSRDINKYLKRLFVFALISQIPFAVADRLIGLPFWFFNVLFTLFFGLLAIKFIRETGDKRMWIIIIAACALAACFFNTDYGAVGVLSVVFFYLTYKSIKWTAVSQAVLFVSQMFVIIVPFYFRHGAFPSGNMLYLEPLGLISLVFIYFYNGKEGRKTRYLFYLFYPLQYIVIILLFK